MKVAETKSQSLMYRNEGIRYGYESGLIETVQWFLTDIGAEKHLSKEENQRLTELKRFHEKLSVDNHAFPENIPFHIIYPCFFTAVVNNSVERKGNNVSAIIGAFRQWIALPDQLDKLQKAYRDEYPDEQPKSLPERTSYSDDHTEAEMNSLIKNTPIEKWPDEVIIDQHKKIYMMMDDDAWRDWLENLGGKGYIKKVLNEVEKRDLIKKQTKKEKV